MYFAIACAEEVNAITVGEVVDGEIEYLYSGAVDPEAVLWGVGPIDGDAVFSVDGQGAANPREIGGGANGGDFRREEDSVLTCLGVGNLDHVVEGPRAGSICDRDRQYRVACEDSAGFQGFEPQLPMLQPDASQEAALTSLALA